MNTVYRLAGTSKQNFHQRLDRMLTKQEEAAQLLPIVIQLRNEHPMMSSRKFYTMLKPETIGRDKFESFCHSNGLKVNQKRNFKKTTDSSGVIRFINLVTGREFTSINQAWVSDITYIRIGEKFYYLTMIMDLHSRYIVGYSLSRRLKTEVTTIPALKMALRKLTPSERKGIIIHSDGGGQYYSKAFLRLTKGMKNSMCETVYENPHAERINGIIKNEYLLPNKPKSYLALKTELDKTIIKYNEIRPHSSLKMKTPADIHFSTAINKRKKKQKRKEDDGVDAFNNKLVLVN